MKLLRFLFGKKPDIFSEKGDVNHQLKGDSWEKWKDRYTHGKEYDWSKHSGIRYTKEAPLKQTKSNTE